jgi:hypothetical protein
MHEKQQTKEKSDEKLKIKKLETPTGKTSPNTLNARSPP